jgi:PIN domain nuclease of toxin-antitoxin system
LLDTSAALAFLWAEAGEAEVAGLLREGGCAISAPCLSEVVDQLIRRGGSEPAEVAERLGPLLDEVVAVPEVDTEIAWRAGELRAEHYDREESDLSQVDCLLLATAGTGDEIASADGSLLGVASGIGIGTIPLPDSSGRRPTI